MSETKWTPGPWEVKQERGAQDPDLVMNYSIVSGEFPDPSSPLVKVAPFDDSAEADAYLIAAAPDLYSENLYARMMLCRYRDECVKIGDVDELAAVEDAIRRLDAAASKALGETSTNS